MKNTDVFPTRLFVSVLNLKTQMHIWANTVNIDNEFAFGKAQCKAEVEMFVTQSEQKQTL